MTLSNRDRQEMFRRHTRAYRGGFYVPLPCHFLAVWRGHECIITSRTRDGAWYVGTHSTNTNGRVYTSRVVLTRDEALQRVLALDG